MTIGVCTGRGKDKKMHIEYGMNHIESGHGCVRTGCHVPAPEIIPDARQRAATFFATASGRPTNPHVSW